MYEQQQLIQVKFLLVQQLQETQLLMLGLDDFINGEEMKMFQLEII